MQNAIEPAYRDDRHKEIVATEDVRRLIGQSRLHPVEDFRPINIEFYVGNERGVRWAGENQYGFRLHRSKMLWVVVMLLLSVGVTYARTRAVCQTFRDQGRFYYGMNVDRCVEVLIQQPLATVETHLSRLDKSY